MLLSGYEMRRTELRLYEKLRDLGFTVATAKVFDEHLLDGLAIGDEDVARGMATDQVTDLFGQILGVISGALQGLGHEDDLQAGLAGNIFRVLDVAEEDQVAQAVDVSIGAENIDGLADIAFGEGGSAVGEHFFQQGCHVGEFASVLGINASPDGLGAVGEVEEVIADALEADHELHAGEEFTGMGGLDRGNGGGHAIVYFQVEGIEFALALAYRIEQRAGAGGDSFSRGRRRFFGHVASLDRAAHEVAVNGLGIWDSDSSGHGLLPKQQRLRVSCSAGKLVNKA